MKAKRLLYILMAAALVIVSCDPVQPDNQEEKKEEQKEEGKKIPEDIMQADQFAYEVLGSYYLWSKEIGKDLDKLKPTVCEDPISVVKQIRYKENDKDVDKWTVLTDDIGSMESSVQGLGLSYGYDLQPYWVDNTQTSIVMAVNYVVKDGPAEKAGVKRGDLIWKLDGKTITKANYYDAYDSKSIVLGIGKDSSKLISVSLSALDMWEDPVLVNKVFDIDGKKVGYLVYNSFDLKSSETLPDVFRQFKADGISELIIDLRYNGGGYTFTECELASMIAPPANVAAKDVFQTEVFNADYAAYLKRQNYDVNTYFSTHHTMASYKIDEDVSDANPGVSKLYAIVSGGTASASEGLIVGLDPYMDITLVGNQTYGKYCAGFMIHPEDWFEKAASYSKIKNWGIYVMISKFADKNGKNAAQPDGIPVDIEVDDNPFDGYQLGDENETMLKAALKAAGKKYTRSSTDVRVPELAPVEGFGSRRPKGILIKTDDFHKVIE